MGSRFIKYRDNFKLDKLKDKCLILVPAETARGGVMNYYKILRKELPEEILYLIRGSRNYPYREGFFRRKVRLFQDYLSCAKYLRTGEFGVLKTTTSFSSGALIRDSVYLLLARRYNVKSIVFFHGGDNSLFSVIEKRWFNLFKSVYFKADAIIDLSKKNIEWFKRKGYKGKLFLETTAVEKELLSEVNEETLKTKINSNRPATHLLFLARIEKDKGIYEAVDAYALVKGHKNIKLTVVGDGLELNKVKEYVSGKGITDIEFLGHKESREKAVIFNDADIYIFPSYYEGMPTSVLEAMAFGLPVVTSAVGGLPDFFENEVHGYITEMKNPETYADLIIKLIDNKELCKSIALNNYNYAQHNFLSDHVAKSIDKIIKEVRDS